MTPTPPLLRLAAPLALLAVASAACAPPIPLDTARAARVAAVMRACGMPYSASSSAEQLMVQSAGTVDRFTQTVMDCAAGAHSCDAFHQCTAAGHAREGAPEGGRCDGDTVVAGLSGVPAALDCHVWGGQGSTCAMGPIGARCEPRGGCGSSSSSSNSSSAPRCEGTVAIDCSNPDFAALDCAQLEPGATCRMVNNQPTCVPGAARPTCAPGQGARCDGDTLVRCAPLNPDGGLLARLLGTVPDNWFQYRTDCGAIGMRCDAGACVPRANACSVQTETGRCVGNVLEMCVGGRVERVDCASLGMTGCEDTSCVR